MPASEPFLSLAAKLDAQRPGARDLSRRYLADRRKMAAAAPRKFVVDARPRMIRVETEYSIVK